jgi:ribose transport system substrate-binding protein
VELFWISWFCFVVVPNDTVGIAGAIEQAIAAGIKVATSLFPIGPDLTTLEPQVEGLTATAAGSPVYGATLQANAVVDYCKDKNPCNTIIMIGQKIYPFDKLRYDTFLDILGKESNVKIVATVEGNYSPDVSLTGMTDALQAAKDVHVVLSNADQHLLGAEIALADAGYIVADLYLMGGGAAKYPSEYGTPINVASHSPALIASIATSAAPPPIKYKSATI